MYLCLGIHNLAFVNLVSLSVWFLYVKNALPQAIEGHSIHIH